VVIFRSQKGSEVWEALLFAYSEWVEEVRQRKKERKKERIKERKKEIIFIAINTRIMAENYLNNKKLVFSFLNLVNLLPSSRRTVFCMTVF